jgi:hypothetical protein
MNRDEYDAMFDFPCSSTWRSYYSSDDEPCRSMYPRKTETQEPVSRGELIPPQEFWQLVSNIMSRNAKVETKKPDNPQSKPPVKPPPKQLTKPVKTVKWVEL